MNSANLNNGHLTLSNRDRFFFFAITFAAVLLALFLASLFGPKFFGFTVSSNLNHNNTNEVANVLPSHDHLNNHLNILANGELVNGHLHHLNVLNNANHAA
ncbi:MAG TPA: hypothetical protein VK550_16140 [Polyangiaceae bacterium]|nr:hypothetical protein [Polyangiaceae bacterium]